MLLRITTAAVSGSVVAPRAATSPLTAEIAEEGAEMRGGRGISAYLSVFLRDLSG
jgi:hypothetical protein